MPMSIDPAEIIACEHERCRALVARDYAALERLVASDLVHIHANGQVDDRDGYLQGVRTRFHFLKVTRRDLVVKVLGDCAVATGLLDQTLEFQDTGLQHELRFVATQVWVNRGGAWRQTSFQATGA